MANCLTTTLRLAISCHFIQVRTAIVMLIPVKLLLQPPVHVFALGPLVHPDNRGMWSGA